MPDKPTTDTATWIAELKQFAANPDRDIRVVVDNDSMYAYDAAAGRDADGNLLDTDVDLVEIPDPRDAIHDLIALALPKVRSHTC